jgi:hypothetical protein
MDLGQTIVQLEKRITTVERAARLRHASIEDTAVLVNDGSGNLRGIIGVQADGTTAVNIVNGAAPPQPTAPVVASVLGGVTAAWDGLFAGGSALPLDWQRVEVHASVTSGFTPDATTLKGTIETPQGATAVIVTDVAVYVRLLARNTSGTASAPSDQAGPYGPTPVVADDIIDGIVTTVKLADDAVTQAKVAVAAIGSTELAAGAVLEEKLAANAVTTGKLADAVITSAKLVDDAVTAAKVATGAIGSDQLALGIGNMAPDPSFEGAYTAQLITGHADWTQTTPGNNSATALHVDCTFGSTTWKNIEVARYPVLPGERHYLGIDFKTSATFNGSGVKLMLRYEDAAATVLGYGVADKAFTPGAGWDRATAQVQAPAGTATAVLLVEASACSAGEAWFDNAEVRTLIAGGMVAAGTITATEIAATTILAGNLAANSVVAGKIAANAVTAGTIAADVVTGREIAANSVTASEVAAGAITTDKLVVTGGANILSDPSFEGAYTAALVTGNADWSVDATLGNGSAKSLKVNAVAGSTTTKSLQISKVPILPGDQLYVAADYLTTADYTSTGSVRFYARWEDSAGAVLGYGIAEATPPTLGGSTWHRITNTVTAPASTVAATIWAQSYQAMAGTVWYDNAVARPVLAGTQIQDGVITTTKIAALTIQAGNIAADAVAAGKIAADAVTAREIAALAVTAAEIAANTITTSKLAAGAVDATSLAADAITGKTITGGTITGATITGGTIQTGTSGERITLNESAQNKVLVYNSSGTAINELSSRGLLVKGTTGAVLWLNPNLTYPQLQLYNAGGTNKATVQVVETVTGDANLETFSAPFSGSGYTDMVWRTFLARDNAVIERRRATTATVVGARLYMEPTFASFGIHNDDDTTQTCSVYVEPNFIHTDAARFQVNPPASANSGLYVNGATGHTGNLVRAAVNGTDKFTVDKDGNLTAAGTLTAASSNTTSGLTAASGFTTTNFYAYRFGKHVALDLYMHRSGTTITATTGNISDTQIATVPAGWRPTHSTINGHWDDGTSSGGWVIGTDGICTLRTASSDIVGDATSSGNGRNLRLHISFIQD